MAEKPIILLGEAYGEQEAKIKAGFVGPSGIELLRMLDAAKVIELTGEDRDYLRRYYDTGNPALIDAIWQMHPEVYRTNVFNIHPPGNKLEYFCCSKTEAKEEGIELLSGWPQLMASKWVRAEYEPELDRLADEILRLDPDLIVCLGNTGLWALAGKTGITKVRGTTCLSTHLVTDFKLLPTYHPSAVLRQWELRPTAIMDLAKAAYESQFPEIRRPARQIWIEPSLDDFRKFRDEHIIPAGFASVDVETIGSQITVIGFSPNPGLAIVVPFFDERKPGRSYWPTVEAEREAWEIARGVLENPAIRKVFQNGLYDIAFMLRSYGIKVMGAEHDTMLLQHAQQPEALKGLGYLGSIYTDEGAWKQERKSTTIKRDE